MFKDSENNREKSSQINNQSEDSDMALKKIKLVEIKEKLLILIENHAEKLLHMGLPILAASVHLSIKDGYSAVIKLIRANYMYEAYILAQTLKIDCLIKYLYQFFCNKIGKYNLLTQASNAIITSSPDINLIANYHIHNKEKIEEFSKMVFSCIFFQIKKMFFLLVSITK